MGVPHWGGRGCPGEVCSGCLSCRAGAWGRRWLGGPSVLCPLTNISSAYWGDKTGRRNPWVRSAFLSASGSLLKNEFNLKATKVVLSSPSGNVRCFDENTEGGVKSGVHLLRLP